MSDVDGVWVPIVMFLVLGVVLVATAYLRFKARQELQMTLREVLSRGDAASPELLESLMESLNPPDADLRRGVVSVGVSIAIVIFALVLGEQDAIPPLLGISAFPALIGAAYLFLWWRRRPALDAA
ncbi:MAG: DUF6249 domain-containing protein [Pseudomonadota bacterium]